MILQYLRQTGGNYLEILTTERLAASDTVFIDLYDHSWGEIEQNGPALVCMSLITREAIGSALVYLFIFGFPFAAVQISVNQLRWHFPAIRSKLPPGLLSFFFPGKLWRDRSICSPSTVFVNALLPRGIRTFRWRKGQTAQQVFAVLNGSLLPNHS